MKATYTVKVHVDADGDMVIIQNPTLAPAIEKSDYKPKTPEADASVDADTVNDATSFLETFFKLSNSHRKGTCLLCIGKCD